MVARHDNHRYHHESNPFPPQSVASLLAFEETHQHQQHHPHPSSSIDLHVELKSSCIKKLQGMRVAIATLFRKCARGSSLHDNAIKCIDLARALTEAPFSLPISLQDAWALVCDMASVPHDSNVEGESAACLVYTDVTRYLDNAEPWLGVGPTGTLIGSRGTGGNIKGAGVGVAGVSEQQALRNIKARLLESHLVKGDRLILLGFTSVLRQRQRLALERGQTSFEASPDTCSPQEFLKLMSSIDVNLTLAESKFVCSCAEATAETRSAKQGVAEGTRLGAAILFLSSLLN